MRIGMLIIGSEILQGKIVDANTVWLAKFLSKKSLELQLTLTVPDQESAILEALKTLYTHCELVFCSGGLGPTKDDITKETLAKFFNKSVHFSEQAHQNAQANYQQFNRTLPENHGYSFLPKDFIALSNPAGFAPGLWFSNGQQHLLAGAGVPKEFSALIDFHFKNLTKPYLTEQKPFTLLNFRTWGVPEERIFKEIDPSLWIKLEAFGSVSSLPHTLGVDIGVKVDDVDDSKIQMIKEIIDQSPIKKHVWHVGFESLEEKIILEAGKRNLTIGFAESCTGGLCANRLTNISGASKVFWGSIVCYDNSIKMNLLHVKPETLQNFGAVSEQTAREMAQGAREALKTDYAISLTGIAGPQGGTSEKPVGTVWMGIADGSGVQAEKFQFNGDREILKMRFSQIALFKLLEKITYRDQE
ncbi:MAG: nicotinamide-nucleotide amidohydrolase family protein [Bacteriovoracaceae bacterium]|nr:nicotinamide-nucleotide amidohydrolase family protein [Bacteriovoracaceae bacterium]